MELNVHLLEYIRSDDLNRVNEFIEKGHDINIVNEKGWTLLRFAAVIGKDKIVSALIEAKANVNEMTNNNMSILYNVLINVPGNKSGRNIRYNIMEQLLNANAFVDQLSFDSTTTLSQCCVYPDADSIVIGKLLMNYGARIENVSKFTLIPRSFKEYNTLLLRRVATSRKALSALLWCSKNAFIPLRGIILQLARAAWAQRGGEGCGARGALWGREDVGG